MITSHHGTWSVAQGWIKALAMTQPPHLLLIFGPKAQLQTEQLTRELTARWPQAMILGCSTAGQIHQTELQEEIVGVTAWCFQHTQLKIVEASVADSASVSAVGTDLARQLNQPGLAHVLVFAEGLSINASLLVQSLEAGLPDHVRVSGGLAGDGEHFKETVSVHLGVYLATTWQPWAFTEKLCMWAVVLVGAGIPLVLSG